jgi:DNA (cytosine-5)-methyltransferase 1
MKLRVLDLFSGIGGFSLGLERTGGFETVAFCEIDPTCQAILAKHWPDVSCAPDIRARDFARGEADVIVGGFPCQDISYAGKRAGLAGERSGLFWEMVRAIRLVRPRYAIVENVAALLTGGMGDVLGTMAADGYDAEWDCVSAADAGSVHGRPRIWIAFSDTNSEQRPERCSTSLRWWQWSAQEAAQTRADANGQRQLEPPRLLGHIWGWLVHGAARDFWSDHWEAKFEALRRMDDGLPTRLDRARVAAAIPPLGNTVVPQIPEAWGRAILSAISEQSHNRN